MDLSGLSRPFRGADLEWRIQRCGKKRNGEIWAIVVPYVTARAIMRRLDEVVGPANWQTDLRPVPIGKAGGMTGGIGIRIDGEWVWKWDAAPASDIEPVKGAASGAIKRAAVQWDMGRDLYGMSDLFARIHDDGEHYTKTEIKVKGGEKEVVEFHWSPPHLPDTPATTSVRGSSAVQSTTSPAPAEDPVAAALGTAQAIANVLDRAALISQAEVADGGNFTATSKQVEFFKKLLHSHVFTDAEVERQLAWLATKANRQTIKDQIDAIKKALEARKAKEAAV